MHVYTWNECHAWFRHQSTCQERVESDKIQNENVLPTAGFEHTVWCSTNWADRAYMKAVLFKWSLYKYIIPIQMDTCMHWYKFKNNAVGHILSCKCTVLCSISEYSYIVHIAKRRTSLAFVFNIQIPDQVECLLVFCMLKASTEFVRIFAICTI